MPIPTPTRDFDAEEALERRDAAHNPNPVMVSRLFSSFNIQHSLATYMVEVLVSDLTRQGYRIVKDPTP